MVPEALAGSAAQKNGIPILSDNNYSEWDASIREFCLYIAFLDYVDGNLSAPSEATPELLMKYKELTQKAVVVICQSLDINNREKFLNKYNKKNPKVLYNSITSYYQSNQSENQARVFCNLLALSYKDKELENFISNVRVQLMHLNSVGIKVGKPPAHIDISNELVPKIISSKLSNGYDNLKRIIYEQRPLETQRIVAKIDDYIRDSYNSSVDEITIKSERAYKIKHYFQNGPHNPMKKHSANQCRQLHPELKKQTRHKNDKKRNTNHQNQTRENHTSQKPPLIFEEDDSSSNDTKVVNYSKAYAEKSNQYPALSYLDTAESSHMLGHQKYFQTYKEKSMSVETADGSHTSVLGHGLVEFKSNDSKFKLHCIHVPEIKEALISMGKPSDNGFSMIRRNHNHFDIKNNKAIMMNGRVCNNMFELNLEIVPPKQSELACVLISGETLHNCAGHTGIEVLKMMFPQVRSVPFCNSCALSK
ncbi:hypothetical protein O181_038820 [Austropuccinia psidii MF-1]|uniref:Retrovirus-related Pol polyprotein from transposon TNT 1-94-like beta-barrel domain-containing protein n=1 Tax=Austropuccinia psidii MF-1 TaxID=1389203 RepID=A0A9Q3HEI4_9BASI|nr:hypothetical protein [Austropuccinia psidii MF-1]